MLFELKKKRKYKVSDNVVFFSQKDFFYVTKFL